MRIAYVTDQLLPQNATDTQQMVSMASALGALTELTLVLPRRWGRPPPSLQEIADYYGAAPTFALEPLRSVYPCVRGIEKLAQAYRGSTVAQTANHDLIYTRTLPTLIAALTTTKVPVVYETYRPWPRQKPRARRFFEWAGRHPNFLGGVFHSEFARSSYLEIGIAPQKLLTAHNGYNPQVILPRLERDDARRRLGMQSETCLFTYAGRVSEKKGLQLVLDAAERFPQHQFLLIGSEGRGPIERRAETFANVVVLPWQSFDETVPYLYASDVLLIPPTSGPLTKVGNTVLPIKTFNYLAVGRAILGPATPDLTELIESERHALLIEPDDQRVFFQAIERLASDAALRARLGTAAQALGAELTWENRAAKICAFIETRLATRGA